MSKQSQRPVNLGESIGARLGAAIIRGDFDTDDRLPTELELSDRFGVSRGAVREGLKVLEDKGLVEARRRRGTRVTSPDRWNLLDPKILEWMRTAEYSHALLKELVEMRLAVEPEAARLLAGRHRTVDFEPLREAAGVLEREDLSDDEKMPADIRFHTGILDAAGNRFYRQMIPLLETSLKFGHELIDIFSAYDARGRVVAADHRALLEAMTRGDGDQAYRQSRRMIQTVLEAVAAALSEGGPGSSQALGGSAKAVLS